MKIHYDLGADDYLTYLLYVASQSEPAKKKRIRLKIIFPVLYFFTGIFFLIASKGSDYSVFIGFFTLAVLWFVLFPKLEYLYRKRQYKSLAKGYYPHGKKESLTLEINDDYIQVKDDTSEGKISTSEIETIDEIQTMLCITLKEDDVFIIPKNELNNPDNVKKRLIELSKHLNVPYVLKE